MKQHKEFEKWWIDHEEQVAVYVPKKMNRLMIKEIMFNVWLAATVEERREAISYMRKMKRK